MTSTSPKFPSEKRLKQEAKHLKKTLCIKQNEALRIVAQNHGFSTWEDLKQALDKEESDKILGVEASTINPEESLKALAKAGVDFATFDTTSTQFKKSIIDATKTIRGLFETESFHFYSSQEKGPDHKIKKQAKLWNGDAFIDSTVSLYRPKTKNGDPRMWFTNIRQVATVSDQVAVVINDDCAYLIPLSIDGIQDALTNTESELYTLACVYVQKHNTIADELLGKLRELAKSPFPTLREGDTGVGFTLESMLGIAANSSRTPDYKGIELKAGRSSKNRTTLFAQVADWKISTLKSSREILDNYGYPRGDDFKLYCTVKANQSNTQGLKLKYNAKDDLIEEIGIGDDKVAVWPGSLLRARLREKHAETFFIQAKSIQINGIEHFKLESVIHTKGPLAMQLLPLIGQSVITMDHLIKRSTKKGKPTVSEKGPLFKISKKDLELLFPSPTTYEL